MTMLTSCWFIIESVIIPDGFVKWFYLSFYIHPILLFLCQILLWLKSLHKLLFLVFLFLFRAINYLLGLCIINLRFLKSLNLLFTPSPPSASTRAQDVTEIPHAISNHSQVVVTETYYQAHEWETGMSELKAYYRVGSVLEMKENVTSTRNTSSTTDVELSANLSPAGSSISSYTDAEMNWEGQISVFPVDDAVVMPPSVSLSPSPLNGSNSSDAELDKNEYSQPQCYPNSQAAEQELIEKNAEQEVDSLYHKYTQRMKWFDVLSRDRLHGLDAIRKKHLGSPADSWSKIARDKLVKSLKIDFELVFVAQSCLSWELLHHQYCKVKTITSSNSPNGVFHKNVAEGFRKFQILLERFMEEESSVGKRYSNYIHRRFSLKTLLQVPEVSGYTEEENERMNGEAMRPSEVLKAIQKCINAFYLFVKGDSKRRPIWKMKSILWPHPPVEDPRDLELLYHLKKTLREKEVMLKELKGKRKCWLKRSVSPLAVETEKEDFVFTMIELKLVTKVLQMSMISTSQLKWCQIKLNNILIDLRHAKVYRTPATYLFPSS